MSARQFPLRAPMLRTLTLLLALTGAAAQADERSEARALVEQKRYVPALEIFDRLLLTHADDADLLIETARVHAWADQHAAAIRRYLETIERVPARRGDVVLPLAWQYLWQGDATRALPFFDEAALRPALAQEAAHGRAESLTALGRLEEAEAIYLRLARQPGDMRAEKGAARLALWRGDAAQAHARYASLVARFPDDREARLGLARALNDKGAHFAALRAYEAATANDPRLAHDTRAERAQTLRWAGFDHAARIVLGDAPGTDELRQALRRDAGAHLRAEFESSSDSDDLDIDALTLGWQPRFGASHLDASVRTARIDQRGTRIDARQFLLRAGTVSGSANGLVQPSLTVGVRDYEDWQSVAWKLSAKWLPADFWRIDFEAGNEVVENLRALQNRVDFDYAALGADWRFAPRWLATLGGAVLDFDDGNQRARGLGRLSYTLRADQPRLVVGGEFVYFSDSDPEIDRGYYNPDTYREGKAFVQAEHRVAGWHLAARVALGRFRETPGNSGDLASWEFSAEREILHALFFKLYGGGSDSGNLSGGGSGYSRDYLGASLHWIY